MASDQVTRCPHCRTVFRVYPDQLAQARGWLRCGQCAEVFDSTGLLVPWPAEVGPDSARMDLQEFLQTEDRAGAGVLPASASASSAAEDPLLAFEQALVTFPGPVPPQSAPQGPAAYSAQPTPADTVPSARPKRRIWLLWVLGMLLLLQLLWAGRDRWVRHVPWMATPVLRLCASLGCQPPLWRDQDHLLIEGSGFVRTDDGYRLEWTLRNTSSWPLRTPAVELVLTGEREDVLVRKVLLPSETEAPISLMPGQVWDAVLLVVPQREVPVTGYRLLAFYP